MNIVYSKIFCLISFLSNVVEKKLFPLCIIDIKIHKLFNFLCLIVVDIFQGFINLRAVFRTIDFTFTVTRLSKKFVYNILLCQN